MVQKSVTERFGDKLVLWTGVSDFRVLRPHLRPVAKALMPTRRSFANHTLNPAGVEPSGFFGMDDGMVSPFLVPGTLALQRLAAIVQLLPCDEWDDGRQIAISLSLRATLMIPGAQLRAVLHAYARQVHPHIQIIHLPVDITASAPVPRGGSGRADAFKVFDQECLTMSALDTPV